MALIKCRECGKEISDQAVSCPNCGAKNKNSEEIATTGLKIICFLIPLIGVIIFAMNISTRPKYAKQCLIASVLPTIIVIIAIIIFVGSVNILIPSNTIESKANIDYEQVRKIEMAKNKLIDDSSLSIYKGNNERIGRIVAVKTDGTVVATGNNEDGQCNVSDWNNIKSVSTSNSHTVGLKEDGTVVATGLNSYKQCNVSNWKNIKKVISISNNTIGLKEDGTLLIIGGNEKELKNISKEWKNLIDIEYADTINSLIGITQTGEVYFDSISKNLDSVVEEVKESLSNFTNITKVVSKNTTVLGININNNLLSTDKYTKTYNLKNIIWINDDIAHNIYGINYYGNLIYLQKGYGSTDKDISAIKEWNNLIYVSVYHYELEKEKYYFLGITQDGQILDNGNNDILDFSNFTNLKIIEDNKNKVY